MNQLKNLLIIAVLAALVRFVALGSVADSTNNILGIFFSVGSVISLWFFIGQLFPDLSHKWLKELSTVFLAISPWHIMLVNFSWQINFAVFLVITGGLVLTKIIRHKVWLFLSIAVLIILSNQFSKPFIFGINNTKAPFWLTDEQRREHGKNYNNQAVKFFHNKVINYSISFFDHYSEHFSGDFLFIAGDVSRNRKIFDFGEMYLFDIVFLFVGIYKVISKFNWKWGIISFWLVLAPINSALTFTPPDSLRSSLMIVPLVMISSFGASTLFSLIYRHTKGWFRYLLIFILLFFIAWDLNRFLQQCFFHVCK